MSADLAAPGSVAPLPALVRHRLTALLEGSDYRVGLIVAPAGSGKSTLVAQVARDHEGPVAWCDVTDPTPRTERALVDALVEAIGPELEVTSPPPADTDELVALLGVHRTPVLVVLDDVHLLEGSEAEAALAHLVERVPSPVRLLLASRVNLDLDLSRARVSGHLVEVGADDLRFRTWEVEQLFRAVYRQHIGPEDVAVLTRRTAGWAAYLQLFHLATARKSPLQRRQMISSFNKPTRLVRDYLSRQVLADLSPELGDFLIRTSVLRRPTGELCDRLIGREGSEGLLAELERRQVFTERVEADDSYRYHAVLLAYLDGRLIETIGVDAAQREHRRAAELLEGSGYLEEAVMAYARAEDWPGVGKVLDRLGLAGDASLGGAWLDLLPAPTLASDPWLLMMKARQSLSRGALRQAVADFSAAEAVASGTLLERCEERRSQIAPWAATDAASGGDWASLLRSATQRAPMAVSRRSARLPEVTGRFVEGLAALLAGDVDAAGRAAQAVSTHGEADGFLVAAADVVTAVVGFASGAELAAGDVALLRESIESAELPWLDRLVRAFEGLSTGAGVTVIEEARHACRSDHDRWGEALITTLEGAAALRWGTGDGTHAARRFEDAATAFTELGAGVLETWAHAWAAVAWWKGSDAARATTEAQQARTLAGLRDVPGASGLAALVLGVATADEHQLRWAEQLLSPFGLWRGPRRLMDGPTAVPTTDGRPAAAAAVGTSSADGGLQIGAGATTVVRCLGRFSLVIDGREIDDSTAKPMERAALHVLAMRAGELVHREELGEALWPGAEPDAARHRLQVAISALRRLIEPVATGAPQYLIRTGDAYCFVLPDDADVDLWRLRDATRAASAARVTGDAIAEIRALEQALVAYGGPLLPGDGPADWAVGPRSAAQSMASAAALRLATLRLKTGDLEGAAAVARAGLEIDRYRDDLWRTAISVAETAGHQAEASQLRSAYEAILVDIGVN